MRLYTAGIADFESIREDGRIYIDKTDPVLLTTILQGHVTLKQ